MFVVKKPSTNEIIATSANQILLPKFLGGTTKASTNIIDSPLGWPRHQLGFNRQWRKSFKDCRRLSCTSLSQAVHMKVLEQVLIRLQGFGLQLKREKCSFLKPSVKYLGYIVDKEGPHATPSISGSHYPSSRTEECTRTLSFLGLVNYYGKFDQYMSTITQPLN